MEEEKGGSCEININSPVSLSLSRRDLVRLRDRIGYLENSLRDLENNQIATQKMISRMIRDTERLRSIFDSLFGEQIAAFVGKGEREERISPAIEAELITLSPSRATKEQIISVMDAIRRVSLDAGGSAPKDEVRARAEEIGIDKEALDEVLARLRKAGALVESAGTLKLI